MVATQPTAKREALDDLSLAPKSRNERLPEWFLPYRQTFCAYLASIYAIGVGFPLDSIKTRQQTHRYKSVWQCVVMTRHNEGLRGFYRGLVAPLLSSSAVRAVSVSMFNVALPYTSGLVFSLYSPTREGASATELIGRRMPVAFLAGMFAGVSCTPVACPFEYTKLASQIDLLVRPPGSGMVPQSTYQVARSLIRNSGVRALYSGWHLHCMRDMVGSAVYFTVYESVKSGLCSLLAPGGQKENASTGSKSTAIAVAGAMAGSVSWLVIYPVDTYKSMVQRDMYARSMGLDIAQLQGRAVDEVRARGILGMYSRRMYRGLTVSLLRTSVMGMMFFSSYEWLIKHV